MKEMAVMDNAGIGLAMGMGQLSLTRNYPPIGADAKDVGADQLFDPHQSAMQEQQELMVQRQQGQGGGQGQGQQQYEHGEQKQAQQQQSGNEQASNPVGAAKQVASGSQGQAQGQGPLLEVARANGANGHMKGENGAEEEDVRSNASNSSMRELEDLLTKLNPLAKEFVPPSLADASTTATSSGGSSKGQARKVGRGGGAGNVFCGG